MNPEPRDAETPPHALSSHVARRAPGRARDAPSTDLDERWVLPPELQGRPCSIYVHGECRPLVNAVAFAMAEMLDLAPLWLEVRNPSKEATEPSVVSAGWIPPERVFVSDAGNGLEPNHLVANLALYSVVRSDEPAEVLLELTDFLRLPELIQQAIGVATIAPTLRAIGVANSERVAHLFPRNRDSLHAFLTSILHRSISLVAAHTGPTGPQRFAFDLVYRVHGSSLAAWGTGALECEKGVHRGPFSMGRPRPLGEIPSIARVLATLAGPDE
jgi:hypothetical protein